MSTPYIRLLLLFKWFSFSPLTDWSDWNNSTLACVLVCFKHPLTSFFVCAQSRHALKLSCLQTRHCTLKPYVKQKYLKAACVRLLVFMLVEKTGTQWFCLWGAVHRPAPLVKDKGTSCQTNFPLPLDWHNFVTEYKFKFTPVGMQPEVVWHDWYAYGRSRFFLLPYSHAACDWSCVLFSSPRRYGKIVSTKAILDKTTNKCKGEL